MKEKIEQQTAEEIFNEILFISKDKSKEEDLKQLLELLKRKPEYARMQITNQLGSKVDQKTDNPLSEQYQAVNYIIDKMNIFPFNLTIEEMQYTDSISCKKNEVTTANDISEVISVPNQALAQQNFADDEITVTHYTVYVSLSNNKIINESQKNYLTGLEPKDKKEKKLVGIGLGSVVIAATIVTAVTVSFVGAAAVFVIGIILAGLVARKLGKMQGKKEANSYYKNSQSTFFHDNKSYEQRALEDNDKKNLIDFIEYNKFDNSFV